MKLTEIITERIGFNIRKCRERKNLSQQELGNLADLQRTYIGQVERGEMNITIRNLVKIAEALEVAPQELFEA